MSSPGTIPNGGPLLVFSGEVQDIEPGTTEIRLVAKGLLSRLNRTLPRRTFQATCPYRLFDPLTCGYGGAPLASTYTTATTVAAGASTTTSVRVSATQASGFWTYGTITVNGETRTIFSSTDAGGGVHVVSLGSPLTAAPAPSDACSLVRGCARTRAWCTTVFNNVINFGGQPDIPPAEATKT
jgi:uncharacterized phage protein (TIGR02218 family)